MICRNDFFKMHPRLYHMTWSGAWNTISQHGLLSTEALLDLYQMTGPERDGILTKQRKKSVLLKDSILGDALIRDQLPMPDSKLHTCLSGRMRIDDWHRMLNRKVFFWTIEDRLKKLIKAKSYRGSDHCILVMDTKSLYMDYEDKIKFSAINSGAIVVPTVERGPNTFSKLDEFPYESYLNKRTKQEIFVELTVDYKVPDVKKHLICAYIGHPEMVEKVLYDPKNQLA